MSKAVENDVPVSIAIFALLSVGCVFLYLTYFRIHPLELEALANLVAGNYEFLVSVSLALLLNMAFSGVYLRRMLGFERQGAKLLVLQGKSRTHSFGRAELLAGCMGVGTYLAIRLLGVGETLPLPAWMTMRIGMAVGLNFALAVYFISRLVFRLLGGLHFSLFGRHELEAPETEPGDIVLGTTPGELAHGAEAGEEEWVKIPWRGVSGGIFISGSIGSGKTQGTILRYLGQILEAGEACPAILAIDPKGMFLEEAEKIIRRAGLGHKIVKISLKGSVSFNPVYMERPLQDSNFASIAEMVRAAAVNFMGKATDSPFWDISSSVLIRNAIAYCSARDGYFTLLDLYRAIVRASKGNLAEELKELLTKKKFTGEERFNIERAIEYFESEFSQLEDRVRTGIVATSTAFINQFQEFAASRVFCPKQEHLSIRSMEEFVREGKILLFDVNQPGLARSMGTFIKLHFEQAVLNQLAELKALKKPCTTVLIIDEYQDVVTCGGGGTIGDDNFMAKARESRPAVIVATQSLSSLMESVGSQRPALVLLQNFRTRIICHSSDLETIELFQKLAGKDDVASETHSLSETAQGAKFNLLAGGFDSKQSSLNESVSKSARREDLVTGKELSRLRTFEAFAQVFDGIDTRFLKLYLKPYFLRLINTKHEAVLDVLRHTENGRAVFRIKKAWSTFASALASLLLAGNVEAAAVPNACTVASSPAFSSCMELTVAGCVCGIPPHPCALITYYAPGTFLEVWPEMKTSYFTAMPGAAAQLGRVAPAPFGAEGDDDTQSYQARAIAVPLASLIFRLMPGGGARNEKLCFDAMSEDMGDQWHTGKGDSLQPLFLAWGAAPKACLLVGAASSIGGFGGGGAGAGGDSPVCSFPLPVTKVLPPTSHPACNGWGVFYPRYGTYAGPASLTGALMIASRLKSLSSEVLHTMPGNTDEKWQMVSPQASSCFREGENAGLLETLRGAREERRLVNGKLKGYLFVIWNRVTTCKEMPTAAQAKAASLAIPAACRGFE